MNEHRKEAERLAMYVRQKSTSTSETIALAQVYATLGLAEETDQCAMPGCECQRITLCEEDETLYGLWYVRKRIAWVDGGKDDKDWDYCDRRQEFMDEVQSEPVDTSS